MLSARAMEQATEIINAAFPEQDEVAQGKIVIATVEGDLHDIGKTIVATLFKANGFDVIDLGRDVSTARIIEAAREAKHEASAPMAQAPKPMLLMSYPVFPSRR